MSSVSSSWTIFTTCWPGVRLFRTSWPSARSRTCATNSLDDVEVDVGLEQREADLAHRASRSPPRRGVPRPRRSPRALWSLSERVSNIAQPGYRVESGPG